jgi:hypothetical protein
VPIIDFISAFRPDPETRRLMGLAYELTLATLRRSDRNDPVVQMIAERIIELAQTGERNPETLCQYALDGLRRHEVASEGRSQGVK